jgi:hypothetical protein
MGFIRFLLWTSICIALGFYAGSWEIDGKTPAQHLKAIWQSSEPQVKGTLEKAKKQLSTREAAPSEQHSEADRDAVNRIVAKRATK